MSLFDRRTVLILPLALAACGFTPVYAPQGTAAGLRGQVEVQAPTDRDSFVLTRELETRLGRGTGRYQLAYSLALTEEGLAVTRAGDITRFNLVGEVTFTLTDSGSGAVLYSGAADNFTGYSDTGSTVETLAAEQDARERLMSILADQVTAQIYAQAQLPAS